MRKYSNGLSSLVWEVTVPVTTSMQVGGLYISNGYVYFIISEGNGRTLCKVNEVNGSLISKVLDDYTNASAMVFDNDNIYLTVYQAGGAKKITKIRKSDLGVVYSVDLKSMEPTVPSSFTPSHLGMVDKSSKICIYGAFMAHQYSVILNKDDGSLFDHYSTIDKGGTSGAFMSPKNAGHKANESPWLVMKNIGSSSSSVYMALLMLNNFYN